MKHFIAGLDEVGRGAFAGPMFAAAAVAHAGWPDIGSSPIEGVRDSKKFTTREAREETFRRLMVHPELIDVGIGIVEVSEIDRVGVDAANQLAFQRALSDLRYPPQMIIVDGNNHVNGWPMSIQVVKPKADALFWPVSAASIIAKVLRDWMMEDLGRIHPEYRWHKNAGYGSKEHQDALRSLGLTPYHRRTFVKKFTVVA